MYNNDTYIYAVISHIVLNKFFAEMFAKVKPQPMHLANSSNKFVKQIKERANLFCNNRSFDTAESLLRNKNGASQLKQTKLNFSCVENPCKKVKYDAMENRNKNHKSKPELILMPLPKKANVAIKCTITATTSATAARVESNAAAQQKQIEITKNCGIELYKNGRDMICIIGRVDFCLKMHKLRPDLNTMWDIYGQLLRIIKGKQRQEFILMLRNGNTGPVLQSSYYDFEQKLVHFRMGCYLRVVGNFIGEYRLRTFKVDKIGLDAWQQDFKRIENVISFALLQNNSQN